MKLRITYKKSSIGYSKTQKATIRSLGLRKLNSVSVREDNNSIRGMIFSVKHLVAVEEVGDEVELMPKPGQNRPARRRPVAVVTEPANVPAATLPRSTAPTAPAPTAVPVIMPTPVAAPAPAPTSVAMPTPVATAVAPALAPVVTPVATAVAPAPAPTPAVAPAPVPAAAAAAVAPAPAKVGLSDDFEIVEGIGPKIASVLRSEGITSLAQLATTEAVVLREMLARHGVAAHPNSWPQQAKLAAEGKFDELMQLQRTLVGGR